jgi:hypothetical protein
VRNDEFTFKNNKVHKYAHRDPAILFSKLTIEEKNFIGESNSLENAYVQNKLFKHKMKNTIEIKVSELPDIQ